MLENEQIAPKDSIISEESAEKTSFYQEGIFSDGFGVLPKIVMFDSDLSIEAKALYALFCSYAGGGESSLAPPVEVIRHYLMIGKKAYYNYLHLLRENGYVLIEQKKVSDGNSLFTVNQYCLPSFPDKFKVNRPDGHLKKEYRQIRERRSMLAAGYGVIPKQPMKYEALSVGAKGLYAYFMLFATRESPVVWPSRNQIMFHLNISHNTLTKYLNELTLSPFVRRIGQKRESGALSSTEYEIVFIPDESAALGSIREMVPSDGIPPQPKKGDTAPWPKKEDAVLRPKKEDTAPRPKKEQTKKGEPKKEETKKEPILLNTSIQNTSSLITSSDSTSSTIPSILSDSSPELEEETESKTDLSVSERKEYKVCASQAELISVPQQGWNEVILSAGNIPYECLKDREVRNAAIDWLCEWETYGTPYFAEYGRNGKNLVSWWQIYRLFCSAVKEMLDPECESWNTSVTYERVWEKIGAVLQMYGEGSKKGRITLFPFAEACMQSFSDAISTHPVTMALSYMKSIIWNALRDGGISRNALYVADEQD